MIWNNPQAYYWTQVLGLRLSFSQPSLQSIEVQSGSVGAEADVGPVPVFKGLAVWTNEKLNAEAHDLVKKMLAAIGVEDFVLLKEGLDVGASQGFEIPAQTSACVCFGPLSEEHLQQWTLPLLQLPEWREFFPPNDAAEILRLKKVAWQKLKEFKIQMGL